MRRLAVVLALLLLVALSGCGASRTEGYCDQLKKDRAKFSELDSGTSSLVSNVELFQRLSDKAPEDLSDEWQTFLNAIRGVSDALKDAGVKPSEFKQGKPSEGLSVAHRKAISDAADQLTSPSVLGAANGIEQQAKDVCKIDLGL